jgi:hypothetical protein
LSLLPPSLPNSLYSIINIYTEKELIHILKGGREKGDLNN